ncbi:hypothetical protein L21SP3_01908 [Sedimentisphaera cyanobacteriorum]|uniref:Transposase DDE domain protein n=1 Tax=Sedimentisphaera cyanobacteriorum TaxID=1940790 RepID=A0A1Q2HS78_9BACT|nr:IS5 family transposase [Sedimentisphaera cyanobacteriorum]AQQ10083.1 hypothetical protein L21SP3_01908 [Sedimentisphaera cyanobacteriorum]
MKAKNNKAGLLFQQPLKPLVNPDHSLVQLSEVVNWSRFEEKFGSLYSPDSGRPAKPIRLMVGLQYLKYTFNLSDEAIVAGWVENPYWQYFCGERYFQHEPPIDPTSMTKWRNKVKSDGLEELLEETIKAGLKLKVIKKNDFNKLVADTTVQQKNITYPTDAKLCHKLRIKLVDLAKASKLQLRQSYERVGKRAYVMQGRYRRARQFKRAKKEVKKLRNYLRRITKEVERNIAGNEQLRIIFDTLLQAAKKLLAQTKKSKNKLYSIHEPHVCCIGKGKSHKKYEFGNKVGIVTTAKNNFIVGALGFEGNPYDGHTLRANLKQTMNLIGREKLGDVYVDGGYKKHGCEDIGNVEIVEKGWRKKKRSIKRWIKRRSRIEPTIGHLKEDNRLGRNFLKGVEGDKMNALGSAFGYNMRKLLKKFTFAYIFMLKIIEFYRNLAMKSKLKTRLA